MTTVIIPKNLTGKSNLVAVPRQAYAEFLAWQKKTKSSQTFKPSTKEIKELVKARKDFVAGKYITLDQLNNYLTPTLSYH